MREIIGVPSDMSERVYSANTKSAPRHNYRLGLPAPTPTEAIHPPRVQSGFSDSEEVVMALQSLIMFLLPLASLAVVSLFAGSL